jgi:hypothetical protein
MRYFSEYLKVDLAFWVLVDSCLATMKEEKAKEKLRNELWSVRFQLTFWLMAAVFCAGVSGFQRKRGLGNSFK